MERTEITKQAEIKVDGVLGGVVVGIDNRDSRYYIVSFDYNPGFPERVKVDRITVDES